MRINTALGQSQTAALDDSDSGEGLAIFFSQDPEAEARYRFVVKATIDQGIYDIGEFYSSPPGATSPPGRLSRLLAIATCPGATGWSVEVSAVPSPEIPEDETADIILASSHCCSAQDGIRRVNERYAYVSALNTGLSSFTVRAGMRITGVAAIGLAAGGTMSVGGGATITVPEGISVNLEPGTDIEPNSVIAIGNCDWVIEWVESA